MAVIAGAWSRTTSMAKNVPAPYPAAEARAARYPRMVWRSATASMRRIIDLPRLLRRLRLRLRP